MRPTWRHHLFFLKFIRVFLARVGTGCACPLKGGVWPSLPANTSDKKDSCSTGAIIDQAHQKNYKINPFCDALISFTHILLILRSGPTYGTNPPAASHLAHKSANHGSWRLLPLASPMGWRRPNQVHQPHPHIMGHDACAWFGCSTHWGQDLCTD
jgi:hypothetical protein